MKTGRNDPCPCGSGKKFKACCGAAGGGRHAADPVDPQALLALFRGGHFAALEEQLEHLLAGRPRHAFLWGLLGAARQMRGKDGLSALRKAAELKPADAEAHCNVGAALHERGQIGAEHSYRRALALDPRHARATLGLANLLAASGRTDAAEAAFRQALKLDPRHPGAMLGLGDTLTRLGRLDEAEELLRQALAGPAAAEAQLCLGNLEQKRGRAAEAEARYSAALAIDPRLARAHNNLGSTLLGQGRTAEAMDCFCAALRIDPGYGDAHANLGVAFARENRFAEAESCCREALARVPARTDFLGQLALALREQGKREEARAVYREWARLDAHAAEPRLGEAMLALPIAPRDRAEADDAPARFGEALEELARWLDADPSHPAALGSAVGAHQPFHLAYRAGNHAALLGRYGDLAAHPFPPPELPAQAGRARIRLAVVANQVRRHSVWDIVLRGLLAHLDRSRFEVVLYHTGSGEDAETAAARAMVDAWREAREFPGFDGLLEKLREDAPDAILYPELGMDPVSFRLAAHRLAPLQMASWGHPVTTGLPSIDLYLSGELLEPEHAAAHYREKLVRLPGTGCCTTPPEIAAEPLADDVAARLDACPGPRLVIAQRAFKADPAHDALYAGIARATGDCSLILLEDPVYPWATTVVRARLETAFRVCGLDPARHLLEIPWLSAGQFRSLLDRCDVFLDCPAFSGYTTAWQAAHAGLPMVTLEGGFLRQRLAAGLLRRIGMTEMIAANEREYVAIAVRLAHEAQVPERRQARRAGLRGAAPLADEDRTVVRAFEAVVAGELARTPAIT